MTRLDDLRADVTRHTGQARALPLLRLGQELAMEYWRLGPGQAVARPALDEAVDALEEAYDLIDRELPLHRQTAAVLGWLVGTRHTAHGGPGRDRERGVALLESAIDVEGPGTLQLTLARLVLAQLLTTGVLGRAAADPLAALSGSTSAADLDRAEVVLRPLLAPDPSRAQVDEAAEMARLLLELGAVVRPLTGGIAGLLGAGPARLVQQAREVQQRLARAARVTLRPDQFFFADDLARLHPLDRPGPVVSGAAPTTPAPARSAPAARPQAAAAPLRAALRARLPGGGVAGLLTIIDGRAPLPDAGTVDHWVALGSMLVEAPGAVDSDRLLFAAAVYLRSAVDGDGWTDESSDDVQIAAASLAAVGSALLAEEPETLAAALRLADVLDDRRPALDAHRQLSTRLGV